MGKHGKKVRCSVCGGSGKIQASSDGKIVTRTCPGCGGSGWA